MSLRTSRFTRPRPVAWFFFLLAFSTCLVLGSWQVKRLYWKKELIEQIATANTTSPLDTLPATETELQALQFRRVTLKGSWRGDIEFHLAPRYWRNQFGYWVITPLRLADGHHVLVNRGWIPATKKDPALRPESAVRGKTTLQGLIRTGAERSRFTPPNQPDKNLWFGRDVADMASHAGLANTLPVMVDLVGTQESGQLPIPSDGTIRLRNDHLSYVLTWYGIAAGILVIFLVYHRRKCSA